MSGHAQSNFEFHVSRAARQRYDFDEALFGITGNVVFADFAAARRFAELIDARPGDVNAMGLVDEVMHHVVELYRRQRNPTAISGALAALEARLGRNSLDRTLEAFAIEFPTVAVQRGEQSAARYLVGCTGSVSNREIVLEELLMLWLANGNPAFAQFDELFNDRALADGTDYPAVVQGLSEYFRTQPPFGPDYEDLISLLRRPALEASESLADQLRWVREHWGFVAERFGDRLLISLDVMAEDERATWMRFHATTGGTIDTTDSAALHGFEEAGYSADAELERFSRDLDWMPHVVLLAKSTYVWLDQLSRAYGWPIWRLDQIPDEELDRLAAAGFTGLWLIGLWERSRASREIKQLRGNPEAVASAYSLMDYSIADDLGGEDAYRNLRERAWQRGMRLASDMVPNHMGIDSRWVIDHPDWFMSRADAPYQAYSYNGPNLSGDDRVGVQIEDHYFDNTDAAVTFKRVDLWTGEARYVYHGNDGTSMPWNDTAQLDYLKPEVREAVIQAILHVARQFPIIRFDAAMTLAKRHIQRLWYPEPGSAGAIPSRAEYSMRKADFDLAMPHEFWREVVDRVAAEAPDTLLLAEAFWLMEGYFVRTLGMHRVYNSAFMNMLRDEKNAEYRLVIKNTLEFDRQILKRYVNFMNNPDERTAIDQFGKGDKYFGTATLLATMPGLPMFGHGQVEGYAERYGMEYRRAYHDETPDLELVARHEREIFPLLHRRHLFAEVDDFALYDFWTGEGAVNEDVIAYSNVRDGQRSLIVYHNRYAETAGWIRTASVTEASLAHGLRLAGGADEWLILGDVRSGLEYLRAQQEIAQSGLHLELHAYECRLFTELRDVRDTDGRYGRLADALAGSGVPSIDEALRLMETGPLRDALLAADEPAAQLAAAALLGVQPPAANPIPATNPVDDRVGAQRAVVGGEIEPDALRLGRSIEALVATTRPDMTRGKWIYDWLADRSWPDADLVALSLDRSPGRRALDLLDDDRFRRAIGVNEHEGVLWFKREQFEHALAWPGLAGALELRPAAAGSDYRLDHLRQALTGVPGWASTRPAPIRPALPGRQAPVPQPPAKKDDAR